VKVVDGRSGRHDVLQCFCDTTLGFLLSQKIRKTP
jgi:hypothetical protein